MRHGERDEVELPLIEQLRGMGWAHLKGAEPAPYQAGAAEPGSGRASYRDVVLEQRLRAGLVRVNPWLADEDAAVGRIVRRVVRPDEAGVNGNIEFTRVLQNGDEITLSDGRARRYRLVDYADPGNNDLLVVSQMRIATPDGYIEPDLVLFVNGLPVVIVECKKPGPSALDQAVADLRSYACPEVQTADTGLALYVQLLIATDREGVRVGTITATPEYFAPWRKADESTPDAVRAGRAPDVTGAVTAQEIAAAELLRPERLTEFLRVFVTDQPTSGRRVKIAARWQQYRAVRRMLSRLRTRGYDTDEPNRYGGVIWHTQGSGKSLTMSFLIRALRASDDLARYLAVVVTDRLDLEEQISHTLEATSGDPVVRTTSIDDARAKLDRDVPHSLLLTIQKAGRAGDEDNADDDASDTDDDEPRPEGIDVPVASDNPEIIVLVDEAHRGQDGTMHAQLRAMLPRSVLVGFTGTPILHGHKKHTEKIFGPLVDIYRLSDAEADGAIVPVRYESREAVAEVAERAEVDAKFESAVPAGPAERQRVARRSARTKAVLEAEGVIAAKADDMIRHWAATAMPDRFAAQVVAVSRLAAVRYRDALLAARDRLVAELRALPPSVRHDPEADDDEHTRFLLSALPHTEFLASIDVAAVISELNAKQEREWRPWTDKASQRTTIGRFKAGLGEPPAEAPETGWAAQTDDMRSGHPISDTGGQPWDGAVEPPSESADSSGTNSAEEPLAFLTVKSMLLTGFDAPVEQILYLDRQITNVSLLQAIARTNRPYRNKTFGLVVDYGANGDELIKQLTRYNPDDLRDVISDGPPDRRMMGSLDAAAAVELEERYTAVMSLLSDQGIESLDTLAERDQLLGLLDDDELHAEFDEANRAFLSAFNALLPREEALRYADAARWLGEIAYVAWRRRRDERNPFNPRDYGAKVRAIIDEHIRVTGVEQRIPPTEITAPDFPEKLDAIGDDRSRALELKTALTVHITSRLAADPVTYGRLSERLEEILRRLDEQHRYADVVLAMSGLRNEILAEERREEDNNLDRWTEGPIYRLFERALAGRPGGPPGVDVRWATDLATEIGEQVQPPHFLYDRALRDQVSKRLRNKMIKEGWLDDDAADSITGDLLQLATSNRERFLEFADKRR